MPRIAYIEQKPMFQSTQLMIKLADEIASEYKAMGYDMTLRQLFYQFVARNYLPNTERSYKSLGEAVNKGRLYGLIDWLHIVDLTRFIRGNPHWEDSEDMMKTAVESFEVDKWVGQKHRVEVWVEKEALAMVVQPQCRELDVDFFSCRGYVSQSEMWRAAQRILDRRLHKKQITVILHLGDHDPSGLDMSRDIKERLKTFGARVRFKRIALNMDQIKKLNPPPNPTKVSDSRSPAYVAEYGESCWELDALPPDALTKLVKKEILKHCNKRKWNRLKAKQEEERRTLESASERWSDVVSFINNGEKE